MTNTNDPGEAAVPGARCRVCGHYETSLARATGRYAHCPACGRAPHWIPVGDDDVRESVPPVAEPPGFRVVGRSGPGVPLPSPGTWVRMGRTDRDGTFAPLTIFTPFHVGGRAVVGVLWSSGFYDILEPIPAAPVAEPAQPVCRVGCGTTRPPGSDGDWHTVGIDEDGSPLFFCTDECANAGYSLNPPPVPPGPVPPEGEPVETRAKGSPGVGMPASLYLQEFGDVIRAAFGAIPYQVGSSLPGSGKASWRDVDVRLILDDERYAAEGYGDPDRQHDSAKWRAMAKAFSLLGRQMTGLPIDFQIQQLTHANREFGTDEPRHYRSALFSRLPLPVCPEGPPAGTGEAVRVFAAENARVQEAAAKGGLRAAGTGAVTSGEATPPISAIERAHQRVPLWDAINRVVAASGGNAGNTSVARQKAVVEVERAVDALQADAIKAAVAGTSDRLAQLETAVAALAKLFPSLPAPPDDDTCDDDDPICGRCGAFCSVDDGAEFERGDPCHPCAQESYSEARAIIERVGGAPAPGMGKL